jgi:hypothetical protein
MASVRKLLDTPSYIVPQSGLETAILVSETERALNCIVIEIGMEQNGNSDSAYEQVVIAQSVWATVWTIGVLGFDFRRGLGIFLLTTVSRTALGPTQPPIQWIPGFLYLGVKRPELEADHSSPSSA